MTLSRGRELCPVLHQHTLEIWEVAETNRFKYGDGVSLVGVCIQQIRSSKTSHARANDGNSSLFRLLHSKGIDGITVQLTMQSQEYE